jgi:acetyl esterase/lipase
VPARWLHYPDMAHGFLNMGLRVDRAWEALREVGLVVRQCLA